MSYYTPGKFHFVWWSFTVAMPLVKGANGAVLLWKWAHGYSSQGLGTTLPQWKLLRGIKGGPNGSAGAPSDVTDGVAAFSRSEVVPKCRKRLPVSANSHFPGMQGRQHLFVAVFSEMSLSGSPAAIGAAPMLWGS
jgi:hypothetical protein